MLITVRLTTCFPGRPSYSSQQIRSRSTSTPHQTLKHKFGIKHIYIASVCLCRALFATPPWNSSVEPGQKLTAPEVSSRHSPSHSHRSYEFLTSNYAASCVAGRIHLHLIRAPWRPPTIGCELVQRQFLAGGCENESGMGLSLWFELRGGCPASSLLSGTSR